jgi:hypothetical protein
MNEGLSPARAIVSFDSSLALPKARALNSTNEEACLGYSPQILTLCDSLGYLVWLDMMTGHELVCSKWQDVTTGRVALVPARKITRSV